MGGPTRESYLAAEERKRQRIAALRTREGVVDLAEWRKALQARVALERLLQDPPWLMRVQLAAAAEVGLELRVELLWDSPEARLCLPSSVNDTPVKVTVRNPARRPCPSGA
jgi:hypothetical protein